MLMPVDGLLDQLTSVHPCCTVSRPARSGVKRRAAATTERAPRLARRRQRRLPRRQPSARATMRAVARCAAAVAAPRAAAARGAGAPRRLHRHLSQAAARRLRLLLRHPHALVLATRGALADRPHHLDAAAFEPPERRVLPQAAHADRRGAETEGGDLTENATGTRRARRPSAPRLRTACAQEEESVVRLVALAYGCRSRRGARGWDQWRHLGEERASSASR